MDSWIDITEFASKYGVSASTLRRRIRGNSIAYKMEKGKYLLQDTPNTLSTAPLFSRIRPSNIKQTVVSVNQVPIHRAQNAPYLHDPVADLMSQSTSAFVNSSVNPAAPSHEELNRLQNENRKLKSQIEELQTLVKALESELDQQAKI